ncbi:hypothetical protein [Colwellia sp. Bg11-12]|uniref:hypothetical protein n=1 Tax=Colwellia sp. Bg11-12 TaxID=2759817 RepID=UPI0015F46A4F|nr:hypothetical protein [Colwellia sp. Bg11-12]MBA6262841.1 hypothetical protein [Colwellia sp. Bg11-12]
MRKVLGLLIVTFIIYGWFDSISDNSDGSEKLEQIRNLAVENVSSIKAINSDYTNVDLFDTQDKEVIGLLLQAIKETEKVSMFKRSPESKKLYIELTSDQGKFGFDVFVPNKVNSPVQFFLVDRTYTGKGFTQESFGKWQSEELWHFLVAAKLVNES